MSWLDDIGLGQLWDRISAIFARKTEAVGSLSYNSGTRMLSWIAVAGNTLDSLSLGTLAKTSEAIGSLTINGSVITMWGVDGSNKGTIDIGSAISSATSGLVTSSHANSTFFSSMNISGKNITLRRPNGSSDSGSVS